MAKKRVKKTHADDVDPALVDAVIVATNFFANCLDEELDPDVAVRKLEEMAYHLQHMKKGVKDAFRACVAAKAADAESDDEREFLSTMCENLGL